MPRRSDAAYGRYGASWETSRTYTVTAHQYDAPASSPETLAADSDTTSEDPASADRAYREFYDDAQQDRLRQTASDYLSRNALVPDSAPSESATSLPSDVEDVLRRNLKDFCALSHFEKMLVLSQWSGESFSSFGTMKWIPRELKRPQSKQFISQRWDKLCRKFPLAAALKSAVRPGRKPLSPADYAALAVANPPRKRGRKPKPRPSSRLIQVDMFLSADPSRLGSPSTPSLRNPNLRNPNHLVYPNQGGGTVTQGKRNPNKVTVTHGVGVQLRNPIAHICELTQPLNRKICKYANSVKIHPLCAVNDSNKSTRAHAHTGARAHTRVQVPNQIKKMI